MKKIVSVCILGSLLSTNVYAQLEDVDFSHVYPKAIYKKSYFGLAVTGAAIVGAGVVSFYTAGAGAPAAATGVGTVASWAGGGSYMAGLSTIGAVVGGDAMVGAAILNGISLGVIGGGVGASAKLATMGIVAKIGIVASVTAAALDGVYYFSDPTTKKLEYRVRVLVPKDLGSDDTQKIVDKLYEIKEDLQESIEDKELEKQKELVLLHKNTINKALGLLKYKLQYPDDQDDFIVLGIIAWNNNEITLFKQALAKINTTNIENRGFLNYLYALKSLAEDDEVKLISYLQNSIDENDYAVEPYILLINLFGNKNFTKNEKRILFLLEQAEDNFDNDKYESNYTLVPLYYRVATLYFINHRYSKAEQYYTKAYEELSILQQHFFGAQLVHIIKIGIANSLYQQGKIKQANEVYQDIIDDIDEEKEKQQIKNQFIGNNK